MTAEKLKHLMQQGLAELEAAGKRKGAEHVITGYKDAEGRQGPRWYLEGFGERAFLRMNSNSYLGLSRHPQVIAAEEDTARLYGTGPGAVRFISGTYGPHIELEQRLAEFHNRPAAMLFSAAYAAVMGVLPQLVTDKTIVLSDALNHNCIINAMRLARPAQKMIYGHLDMRGLEEKLRAAVGHFKRVLIVTDGIFSMRGDHAPLDKITALSRKYEESFLEGIITVADDSHGVGVFGYTGRGVEEYTGVKVHILLATLGKGFGVNGGYVVADREVIDFLRETSPFYVYSNPITPSEAAAANQAIDLVDSSTGLELLTGLRRLANRLQEGLHKLGYESIIGEHPIVPLMVRNSARTAALVQHLFANDILVTGLNYPVVPKGDEEIRFQVAADHTEADIDYVLTVLADFSGSQ